MEYIWALTAEKAPGYALPTAGPPPQPRLPKGFPAPPPQGSPVIFSSVGYKHVPGPLEE